jgi:hypothetical protein
MMSDGLDFPLSPEARTLMDRVRPRVAAELASLSKIPVSILLWGPSLTSELALAQLRIELRSTLRAQGHAAFYSEELCDPESQFSLRVQQIAQAQEFDLVVSLPGTPGSVGEAHDFAADRRIHAKLLVFLNRTDLAGYSSKSLRALNAIMACELIYYDGEDDFHSVFEAVASQVTRIREMKYILAGRY